MTSNQKTTLETNPIQVADKIFMIIELLADRGPMGLIEISHELNLNKTTVHRSLNSLIYMGYVMQSKSSLRYRLGFKICDISNKVLNKIDIVKIVHPYLQELVDATGETVHFVQLDGDYAVYIDKIESTDNSIRLVSQLGKRLPLYCSGVGKALLADMSDDEIQKIWNESNIKALTPHTITDFNALKKEIALIKERGYSLDNEENEIGIRCIAASLGCSTNESSYAFSISAPIYRMSDERIEELRVHVLNAKEKIKQII
ncbi:MAG: IclR family transcriptional regulator [Suipraeoptans sp.]